MLKTAVVVVSGVVVAANLLVAGAAPIAAQQQPPAAGAQQPPPAQPPRVRRPDAVRAGVAAAVDADRHRLPTRTARVSSPSSTAPA